MKVELLLAGYRLTVACGWVEGPLLDRCNDGFVDAVAKAAGYLEIGDFSGSIDDDIDDNVAFRAAGKRGKIGLRRGKEAGQSYIDVAGAERVGVDGGVGLCGDGRVCVG